MKPFDALLHVLLSLTLLSAAAACNPDGEPAAPAEQTDHPAGGSEAGGSETDMPDGGGPAPAAAMLRISVGGTHFTAALEDNAAAQAFAARLPLTLDMNELNGNEKFCYLETPLPADASPAGTIRAGDLMLWGSNCVVLFYDTFPSPYSYTRLGRVTDPSGLASAVGTGRTAVAFSL